MTQLPEYRYQGARAMVQLHEHHLREFVDVWREAKAAKVKLAKVEDPDYRSFDHLLRHVLRAARGYMTWMCEVLELADPRIDKTPEADTIASKAETCLEHVLEKWRTPLANVEELRFGPTYKARWGMDYSIDSMLEHAVMHPIRHTFQLRQLLNK